MRNAERLVTRWNKLRVMEAAGGQIQGARRRQEDAYAIEWIGEGACLALVADGLGGLPAGDVASKEGIAEFLRVFRDEAGVPNTSPLVWLRAALIAADRHLHRRQIEEPALFGMSTTLVAFYARGSEAYALSVGDSYLMLQRNDVLYVLNKLHREGSALTSCVGAHLSEVDIPEPLRIKSGDRFLLATDGITTLNEATIKQIFAPAGSAQEATRALLEAVEHALNLHQDNATVVAVLVP